MGKSAREDYHFTTPQRREEMRQQAFGTGDQKLFGAYLHALQDSYSHQMFNIPFEATVGHLHAGTFPDLTILRPNVADGMALDTYVEMQNFLNRNEVIAQKPWIEIKNSVGEFNRSYLDRSKQNALGQ